MQYVSIWSLVYLEFKVYLLKKYMHLYKLWSLPKFGMQKKDSVFVCFYPCTNGNYHSILYNKDIVWNIKVPNCVDINKYKVPQKCYVDIM